MWRSDVPGNAQGMTASGGLIAIDLTKLRLVNGPLLAGTPTFPDSRWIELYNRSRQLLFVTVQC